MTFTYGFIEPGEGQDLDAWRKVIGLRDSEGEGDNKRGGGEKSSLAKVVDKAKKLMMKVMPFRTIDIGTAVE